MRTGLKHQKEKRSMDYFAGLDVSVKETSVCIVDDTGKIVREVKVASEPAALLSDAGLEPHRPNHPDLETEVAQSSSSRTCPTWRRWSNRCASPEP